MSNELSSSDDAVVLNVAFVVPESVRKRFCELSSTIAERMKRGGTHSTFVLGEEHEDHSSSNCSPHLTAYRREQLRSTVSALVVAMQSELQGAKPFRLVGREWKLNPYGAVELLCDAHPPEAWHDAQRRVIQAAGQISGGKHPEFDPSGVPIAEMMAALLQVPDELAKAQHANLEAYGYEQIGPLAFNPHITFAWPKDASYEYPLQELPGPDSFRFRVSEIGVFEESHRHGACINSLNVAHLGTSRGLDQAHTFP